MAIDAERAGGRVGQDDVRAKALSLSNEARERAMAGERHALQLRRAAQRSGVRCKRVLGGVGLSLVALILKEE
jgi:hypothetical protein